MTVPETRAFELVATVNFPNLRAAEYDAFVAKLNMAVGEVIVEYPSAVAFLVAPESTVGDVTFGVRFKGAAPQYISDMADEILEKAVERVAQSEDGSPIRAEREESVLVLT